MKRLLFAATLAGLSMTGGLLWGSESWPQFRGPDGNGCSDARNLPITWSEKANVRWKTAIHGRAWSSPVVWGDQVWVSTASEHGHHLYAVCVNRQTGRIIYDLKLFDVVKPQYIHPFNTYASPTPVIERGYIYVTFGSPGTACVDTHTGRVVWTRRDFVCNHYRGAGSSPILFGDRLIMNFDGSDHQFVVALRKRTGKTLWRTERSIDFKDLQPDGQPLGGGDFRKAFSTPQVAVFHGRPTLISLGAKAAYGYDPANGKEQWRVEERTSHSAATRPVVGFGMIFYPTGFSRGQLLAIRPGANGAVIDANAPPASYQPDDPQIVWRVKRSVPLKPSILLVGNLIFMIDDGGIATCLEARTGAEVWRERVGGNYSASPVSADGRIYFFSEEGETTVIEAGRRFQVLAHNLLDDGFMASPAIAGSALFLRTATHLYRVERQSPVSSQLICGKGKRAENGA